MGVTVCSPKIRQDYFSAYRILIYRGSVPTGSCLYAQRFLRLMLIPSTPLYREKLNGIKAYGL